MVERIEFDVFEEGRYDRQARIGWWDQPRLAGASVIVAGAGALGNEVLKLLALIGFGQVTVVDFDRVSRSNLARTLLFRESDIGRLKVEAAAERLRELNPALNVHPVPGDLRFDLGLGDYRRADLVFGCLDSVEARQALNRKCRLAGVEWLNGGISDFHGQVTRYAVEGGACYECTFTDATWERLGRRYSCPYGLRLPDDAPAVPTTAVTSSAVAALLVQEALLRLHGEPGGLAPAERLSLYLKPYRLLLDRLPLNPDCLAHETLPDVPIPTLAASVRTLTAGQALQAAQALRPEVAALELPYDLVTGFDCPNCGPAEATPRPKGRVFQHEAACPRCAALRAPQIERQVTAASPLAALPLSALGLPEHEILAFHNDTGGDPLYLELVT